MQKKNKLPLPSSLGKAIHIVAKLGGYIGRKNDPPPGHQVMWGGYITLQSMCVGYQLLEGG